MQSNIKNKYVERLSLLIKSGESLREQSKQNDTGRIYNRPGQSRYTTTHFIPNDAFTEWQTNCISLLDTVVPKSSIHRSSVEKFHSFSNIPSSKQFGVSFLKAILQDFEQGFLDNIEHQIDAEVNADFLTQAESLIKFGRSEKAHIPAAVIAGAVLEHGLRTICQSLDPPEPLETNGKHKMMSLLIDALKKRCVYNELTAKQLRSYADIRNAAAHGKFDDFTSSQVENMVSGVGSFLARYSPS